MSGQTSIDICEIIRTCGENDVERISFADVVIDFRKSKDTVAELEDIAYSNPLAKSNEIEDTIDNGTMEDIDLALSDPEEYERYIMGEEDE